MSARKEPTPKSRAASRNLTRSIERTSRSVWSESLSTHLDNETIQYPDGRVELTPDAFAEISASPLFNHDLAPVKIAERNWTTYNYAALWISMAHCIPTYMLSSGLISAGMNWWQALITI